jgi:ribosome biogenesis GTPase
VRTIAGDAPVVALCAETAAGCRKLAPWLQRGQTVVLLGPSGVGKSTIVNHLMRDAVQAIQDVRGKDRKGRHTTTRRELFVAPSGALLIDTPGMRELQLWASDVADAFADIAALTARCRFTNCGHEREPGCAVRAALASGELSEARWLSYLKLRAEQDALTRHLAARPERTEKIVWRKVSKALRVAQRHFEEASRTEGGRDGRPRTQNLTRPGMRLLGCAPCSASWVAMGRNTVPCRWTR